MSWQRQSGQKFFFLLLIIGVMGATGCLKSEYLKRPVKGPILRDSLQGKSLHAKVDGGTFAKDGWMPGAEGTLTYDLPAMTHGMISMDVTGMTRNSPDTLFLTVFEPADSMYADPFIIYNPYKITLTANNYHTAPDSPFAFLWTMKNFPAGTPEEGRYVEGLPENVPGYVKSLNSSAMPIFPNEKYTVQLQWEYGKARLIVNGEILAEHVYSPLIFNVPKLRMVIGRSPGGQPLDMPSLKISNVWVSYPSIYQ